MRASRSQSMRSIRSSNTLKSVRSDYDPPCLLDFDEYLAMACKKFPCHHPIIVRKELRDDNPFKLNTRSAVIKMRKINIVTQFVNEAILAELKKDDAYSAPANIMPITLVDEETIPLDTLYNNMNQLVEIGIHKVNHIPRELMQFIGIIAPFFEQLAKINITKCRIDIYTVYELSKMLPLSFITEVCFDQSPLPEANYAILLDTPRLKVLSLRQCYINDEVCKQLTARLHFSAPAETSLVTLNLSSNQITDVGAKYIADVLRTNRHLRYLNLADNRLCDEGACNILDSLMLYPLTYDEIVSKRGRYLDYLRMRKALFLKYFSELECKSNDESQVIKKAAAKKRKTSATSLRSKSSAKKEKTAEDYFIAKAEMWAAEMMGPFTDPFGSAFTKIQDNYTYCVGNLCLSYLNLSYNNLSYPSLKKLRNVIGYQARNKKVGQQGLIKVVIEGNLLPTVCTELRVINEIFNRNMSAFGSRAQSEMSKRKSRVAPRVSVVPDRGISSQK